MPEINNTFPSFIPDNTVELDSQILRIHNTANFKNKNLTKLLSDDLVRSYLDEYQIKALYHLVACYEGLVDASTGKYDGVFDNGAELVLADIMFIVNIARSKAGVNVRVIKGRSPLEEMRKVDWIDKMRPFQQNQSNNQQQTIQPNNNDFYANQPR